MPADDAMLLMRWVEDRDGEAFKELVSRYSRMVFSACNRIVQNATDAEDLTQDCFEALVYVGKKPGPYLGAWLHRVATFHALNHVRGQNRRRQREEEYFTVATEAREMQWNEINPFLDEAINALPDKLRIPLLAYYLDDQTHEGIGEHLGISRSLVGFRVRRGVEIIRASLKKRGIYATGSLLGTLIAANAGKAAAEVVPATLAARLGKVGLVGPRMSPRIETIARGAASASHTPAFSGMAVAKVASAIIVAGSVVVAGLWAANAWNGTALNEVQQTPQTDVSVAATIPTVAPNAAAAPVAKAAAGKADPRTVEGFVKSETGIPRPGVYFSREWPNGDASGRQSDRNGHFTLESDIPGQTGWMAYSESTRRAALFTTPEGPEPLTVTLDCGVAELLGRVVDGSNKPVAKARVELRIVNEAGVAFVSSKLVTDVQGYYDSTYVPAKDGFSIQARVVPPKDEPPGDWSAAKLLSKRTHFVDLAELDVSDATAANIAQNETYAGLKSCYLDSLQNAKPMESYGGTVRDSEGRGIADVRVELTYQTGPVGVHIVQAGTDSQGRWTRLLPSDASHVTVRLSHPGFAGTVFSGQESGASLARLREGTCELAMDPGLRISGIVLGEDGQPIADALALPHELYGRTAGGPEETANAPIEDEYSARTGPDGRFELTGLPMGARELEIEKPGYVPKLASVVVDSRTPPVNVVLNHGGVVRGRIVDEAGAPVPGAFIHGLDWRLGERCRMFNAKATVDADGRFTLENVPTEGTLNVNYGAKKQGWLFVREYMPMGTSILKPRTEPYELVLYSLPILEGAVVDDATGQPIREFDVRLAMKWPGLEGVHWLKMADTSHVKSPNGRFRQKVKGAVASFPELTSFAVGIFAEGYVPATSELQQMGEKAQPLTIRLKKGVEVTGVVTDTAGAPVPGAHVMAIGPTQTAYVADGQLQEHMVNTPDKIETDEQGRFKLPPWEKPGALLVLHPAGYAYRAPGEFEPGSAASLVEWARVEGTIYHGDEPAPGAGVAIRLSGGVADPNGPVHWYYWLAADESGRFEFENVPSIQLSIGRQPGRAYYYSGWTHTVPIHPKPGETLDVEIGRGGRSVDGEIVLPLPSEVTAVFDPKYTRINATQSAPDGSAIISVPRFVPTLDAGGAIHFENVPPGDYDLAMEFREPRQPDTHADGKLLAVGKLHFTVPDDGDGTPVALPPVTLSVPE